MSSKLVKKLLQQTNRSLSTTEEEDGWELQSRKRKAVTKVPSKNDGPTKEDMLQSHIQSILRLDDRIQSNASKTAKKSFTRHSSNIKKQQKALSSSKKNAAGVGNSRSSTSSFAKKKHEPTYDKVKARQQKEEDYFEGVAKALRKAKKKRKIS